MADDPQDTQATTAEPPTPEVLQSQSTDASAPEPEEQATAEKKTLQPNKQRTYQPSHKATFIGLSVVALILAINVGVIAFLLNSGTVADAELQKDAVTISPGVLDTLGVSRNAVGNKGTELVVGPDSTFNGKVTMGSDVVIAGKLALKNKFSAPDASFAKLEAGETALGQLNVNDDATITNVNVRQQLNVAGATRIQGPVTISQLVTINNSLNLAGNLAVGGTLSARNFQANSLTSGSTLVVGGHFITRGTSPGIGRGSGLGATTTVSVGGNDASGSVVVNVGNDGASGELAKIAFRSNYGIVPHVVISPVNKYANVYVTRSIGGFTVYSSGSLSSGTYIFDYIVMQ